ncbi:phosphoribosylaminoimidazolesuccinocarboxamide synthase, partial [Dictyoglomus sp.]|uniref:phosphoribosylaminoimidazolesuccinocarboxamide synthase n=1 Tax=Dictyoglomus sp. TaxID=28205 RepID=UPI003D1250CC
MGSVKDLIIIESPTEKSLGRGRFVFSDRYSVFDYGEMPDHIDDKGKAICIATAYFFEKLENLGIKTHYVGLVEDDKIKTLYELKKPTNVMEFKMVRVIKPDLKDNIYDYSVFKKEKSNFLIPLEVIYRNSLPEGSSVFER